MSPHQAVRLHTDQHKGNTAPCRCKSVHACSSIATAPNSRHSFQTCNELLGAAKGGARGDTGVRRCWRAVFTVCQGSAVPLHTSLSLVLPAARVDCFNISTPGIQLNCRVTTCMAATGFRTARAYCKGMVLLLLCNLVWTCVQGLCKHYFSGVLLI